MLKFFEAEESFQKVILLITSQEFNKVPSPGGPFLSRSDPLSYEDLEIPAARDDASLEQRMLHG